MLEYLRAELMLSALGSFTRTVCIYIKFLPQDLVVDGPMYGSPVGGLRPLRRLALALTLADVRCFCCTQCVADRGCGEY